MTGYPGDRLGLQTGEIRIAFDAISLALAPMLIQAIEALELPVEEITPSDTRPGRGLHVVFDNGCYLSVQWHDGVNSNVGRRQAIGDEGPTFEVTGFEPDGRRIKAVGWVPLRGVLDIAHMVAFHDDITRGA